MSRAHSFISRPICAITGIAAVTLCWAVAYAKAAEPAKAEVLGRINFENANLPPANVELDLSQSMFGDLFGIGDAAVAGVAETLMKSSKGDNGEMTRMAAEKLAAVRQIIELAGKVVHEVRVRAYEKMAEDLSPRFDQQLGSGRWEKIVVLRKGDENARVFVAHEGDSIRGIFVVAGGRGGLALVNVVCDISPDNVKKLTSAATQIGLDNGLQQEIEMKFRHMHRMGPGPVAPPQPPKPPRVPEVPKRDAA